MQKFIVHRPWSRSFSPKQLYVKNKSTTGRHTPPPPPRTLLYRTLYVHRYSCQAWSSVVGIILCIHKFHFESFSGYWPSASNDPKSHIPHILWSHISCGFSLGPAASELQAILRQVYHNDFNLDHYKVKCTSYMCICMDSISESKLQKVLLYDQPFPNYRPFWDNCINWPKKMILKTIMSKTNHMCVTSIPETQISLIFTLRPWVFEIQGCRKPEMQRITSNWLWTFNGWKYRVYTKYWPPRPKRVVLSL